MTAVYFGVHLYLHVPFCARRCSYCDFAIAVRRRVPSDEFADAVLREWEGWQSHPAWETSPDIATIYLGGGTPSLLDPESLARVLAAVRRDRSVAADAEVTLEANPEDVTAERCRAWVAMGVNRVSLGAQTFDPAVLDWMHRVHGPARIPNAVAVLREAGLTNVSLDLIFGLPEDLGRDWRRDLDAALALEPAHLSLYGLTVEPHTPLHRWAGRGEIRPVSEERYAAEYLAAVAALGSRGYAFYEVSNASRPAAESRHNRAYWTRAPYIGLGPSAHSGLGPERRWNRREWADYARAATAGDDLVEGRERLDRAALRLEALYLGLRTRDGVPEDWLSPADAGRWRAEGWAAAPAPDRRLRLTPEGWLRLDALVAAV